MTANQAIWAEACRRLRAALTAAGFPGELAGLLARQLGSPRAIDRMTSYIDQAKPRSMEMLADEMLAICTEIQTWRDKKASEEAQARYNEMLFYGTFQNNETEE